MSGGGRRRGLGQARSLLFVPGNRPDRFEKACGSGADAVVIDLEDAVPPSAKDDARQHAARLLRAGPFAPLLVRINDPSSTAGRDDLEMLARCAPFDRAAGATAIMIPKADAERVRKVGRMLDLPVVPLLETAQGMLDAAATARLPSVERLAFGHLDLAAEMGLDPDDEPRLWPARFALLLASVAGGLPGPIDGVTREVRDPERAETDARTAAASGFTGKLCVHPDQVPAVHAGMRPDPSQLAWADSILKSAEEGVSTSGGSMVDAPVLTRARSLRARADSDTMDP